MTLFIDIKKVVFQSHVHGGSNIPCGQSKPHALVFYTHFMHFMHIDELRFLLLRKIDVSAFRTQLQNRQLWTFADSIEHKVQSRTGKLSILAFMLSR